MGVINDIKDSCVGFALQVQVPVFSMTPHWHDFLSSSDYNRAIINVVSNTCAFLL